MSHTSSLAASLLLVLAALSLPLAEAAGADGSCTLPNTDTTPPFTDRCYHQGVWFSPDTATLDVLLLPPQSAWELRDWQLVEQSVANWEAAIRQHAAPWLASGLRINDYTVGREPVPPAALADPEIVILLHATAVPLVGFAGAATQSPGICHGLELPNDPTTVLTWQSHDGQLGSYTMGCNGGGRVCVVTDAAPFFVPDDEDRRVAFDLLSHEIGHCLSLGHVGDADTESTDDSVAYPEHDIMSYETDGLVERTMHCPSNLDLRTLETAYGVLLGRPGATTAIAPQAGAYVHMQPADWSATPCQQSTAGFLDTGHALASDPAGLSGPDADGDDVPDADDTCPGHDDRADADDDGLADGCDADDTDGPGGDADGDGVRNADDACPGLDDASPACLGAGSAAVLYLGTGALGTPSGNAEVAYGDSAFLQHALRLKADAPTAPTPSTILAPGVRGTVTHNPLYEPAEWAATSPVALRGQDVEVVWWAVEPATGLAFYEEWDVSVFVDGAATPLATHHLVMAGDVDGAVPTEYRVTFPALTATGVLSVLIDPAPFTNQADFLILYDSIDYPSRVLISEVPDGDGDGVADDVDACPGSDDALDADRDGVPDGCDADVDGDGALNAADNCPTPNADQADADGDGVGDACDGDRDGDGVANADDAFPDDPSESGDADGDGVGDIADACAGHDDRADLDGDGVPDGCDADRDGDGHGNDAETSAGSDPDDASSTPTPPPTCGTLPTGKPRPGCRR